MPTLPTAPSTHRLSCPVCRYIAWRPRIGCCGHTICGQCCDLGLDHCPVCGRDEPAWSNNWALRPFIEAHLDTSRTLAHRTAARADAIVTLCHQEQPPITLLSVDGLSPSAVLRALRALRSDRRDWFQSGQEETQLPRGRTRIVAIINNTVYLFCPPE